MSYRTAKVLPGVGFSWQACRGPEAEDETLLGICTIQLLGSGTQGDPTFLESRLAPTSRWVACLMSEAHGSLSGLALHWNNF